MIHTQYGGSGLGLFICKSKFCGGFGTFLETPDRTEITELLGGRIEVRSELGHGSVFRFFIQARAIAPPARPPLLPTAESSNGSATSTSTIASSNSSIVLTSASPPPEGVDELHILIVEDNIINQTVLKRQIIKAGLTCDGEFGYKIGPPQLAIHVRPSGPFMIHFSVFQVLIEQSRTTDSKR